MSLYRICARFVLVPVLVVCFGALARANDYRVNRGDQIEISVIGYPDLTRKLMVNTAGEVAVPFVGSLSVAGKTVDEVRDTLKKLLSDKNVVRGAEIVIGIAEYAPVYVNGDVAKPGAYGFRPGMTVRHAIALASGFSMKPEGVTAADLWGQYRAATLDSIKANAKLIRLQAELSGDEKPDFSRLNASPSDQALAGRIIELETAQFNARNLDRKRELDYLNEMKILARRQRETLEAQLKGEKGVIDSLTADYERVRNAFGRGVLPAMRLAESLQALALVKSRAATNAAQIAEASRVEGDFERRAQKLGDTERMKIMSELQDALVEAEVTQTRLRVAREKFAKGGVRGQLGSYADLEIRIFRSGTRSAMAADEGTALQSGDVVEVRVPYDDMPPSAQRPTGRAQSTE